MKKIVMALPMVMLFSSALASQVSSESELAAALASDQSAIALSGTLTLAGDLPDIDRELTIDGTEAVIDCAGHSGFSLTSNARLTIRGVEMRNCVNDGDGGAVFAAEGAQLAVDSCRFVDNTGAHGGAIALDQASATIVDSHFSGNRSTAHGGAVYLLKGSLRVENSTLQKNKAAFTGGAISSRHGTVVVQGSDISGNAAQVGGGLANAGGEVQLRGPGMTMNDNVTEYYGGAIQNEGEKASLLAVRVEARGNRATSGGFAYNKYADLELRDSTISANRATSDGGGAIHAIGGKTSATATLFENNTSFSNGGAWLGSGRLQAYAGTRFVGNEAVERGGAIAMTRDEHLSGLNIRSAHFAHNKGGQMGGALLVRGHANILGSSFVENTAQRGGAIQIDFTAITVRASVINSTIANNHALRGGAIHATAGAAIDNLLEIKNSTIAYNTASEASTAFHFVQLPRCVIGNAIVAGPIGAEHSLAQGNCRSAGGNVFTSPVASMRLHPSDRVGTESRPMDPGLADLREGPEGSYFPLVEGSPAIDHGRAENAVRRSGQMLDTDQRGAGFPRVRGDAVDAGAIESAPSDS